MRISDWSSDVCSSDLFASSHRAPESAHSENQMSARAHMNSPGTLDRAATTVAIVGSGFGGLCMAIQLKKAGIDSFVILEKAGSVGGTWRRSEEHTSELQSLMRISYAVFCLKKKTNKYDHTTLIQT